MPTLSSVGNSQAYSADDQRTSKTSHDDHAAYEEGVPNSHKANDSKDQRSIANRLAAAEKKEHERTDDTGTEDPRAPALKHGNEPSRGAKIDAELQAEDEAELERKGKKGKDTLPGKKN